MNQSERRILALLQELLACPRVTRDAVWKIAVSIEEGTYLRPAKNTVTAPACEFPLDTVTVRVA